MEVAEESATATNQCPEAAGVLADDTEAEPLLSPPRFGPRLNRRLNPIRHAELLNQAGVQDGSVSRLLDDQLVRWLVEGP